MAKVPPRLRVPGASKGDPTIENDGDKTAEDTESAVERTEGFSDDTHVIMRRDPEFYDPPHEAEVHRDEIDNWRPHGWVVTEASEDE